jgi:zinc D-Ala-D-Ala carboxypeptidase
VAGMRGRRMSIAAGLALAIAACGEEPAEAPDEAPAAVEAPAAPDATAMDGPQPAGPSAEPAPDLQPEAPASPSPSAAAPATPVPEDVRVLMGDVAPSASGGLLVAIPADLASRGGMYGHKDAVEAFARMHAAAKAEGVELRIISAFRSFRDQKRIWDNKWNGTTRVEGGRLPDTVPEPAARARKILEYSSMPGTSRHHWGTDFDLNDLTNGYFASGEGKRVHDWLSANAAAYGFCQVYSPKGPERPAGYEREDWHWSYMPAASGYLARYLELVGYDRLGGFEGAETAAEIDVIANYVRGVDPRCG